MSSCVIPQSAEQIAALCRSFNDTQADGMEGARDSQDPPPRPLARHLSDADRLRKVIQELVDTEKSYVKVAEDAVCPSRSVLPSAVASRVWAGGPQTGSARDSVVREGDALAPWRNESLQRRQGRARGWACSGDSEKIRIPGSFCCQGSFRYGNMFWFVICNLWEGHLCRFSKRGTETTLGDEEPGNNLPIATADSGPLPGLMVAAVRDRAPWCLHSCHVDMATQSQRGNCGASFTPEEFTHLTQKLPVSGKRSCS